MKDYRILVIGCGSIGQRHSRLLSERSDIDLFLADPNLHNLNTCASVAKPREVFEDYRKALDQKMDGVFVCSPNQLHVEMAVASLESGASVMIEKPVAPTVHEAETLLSHESPESSRIVVGYVNRFDRLLRHIRRLVDDDALGNLVHATSWVSSYFTLLCAKSDFREKEPWTLVVDYTHDIDFLRYLAGDVQEVSAMASRLGELEHMADPNVVDILLRFRSGVIGSIHMDYVRHPEKKSLELIGDRRSLEFSQSKGLLRIYDAATEEVQEINRPYVRDDLFRDQIGNFLEVIAGRQRPLVGLRDGIEALKVAEAVMLSSREHRSVNVPAE